MKKLAFLLLTGLMSSGVVFAQSVQLTELEKAQMQIIKLQQENMKLLTQLTTTYKSAGICFSDNWHCTKERDLLNANLSLFSTNKLSMTSSCQVDPSEAGTVCEDRKYVLKMYVNITPN